MGFRSFSPPFFVVEICMGRYKRSRHLLHGGTKVQKISMKLRLTLTLEYLIVAALTGALMSYAIVWSVSTQLWCDVRTILLTNSIAIESH